MGKRKKYIDYDYDEVFDEPLEQLEESRIIQALKTKEITSAYATKKIKSGNQLEVEIYPEFTKKKRITADGRFKKHKDVQRNLNAKNARKCLIRLINTNFTSSDYWLTLSFAKAPKDEAEAMRHVKNYIKCINRLRNKKGLENAKYIYVVETSNSDGEKVRPHVHMIMEHGLSMDELESKWKHARRNQCRRLDKEEENGLEGLANYFVKAPKNTKYKKKWVSSKNLKKPQIRKNHTDFSNRKIKKMVEDVASIPAIMTKKFNAEYKDCQIRYNSYNNKWYLYVKMYFKE